MQQNSFFNFNCVIRKWCNAKCMHHVFSLKSYIEKKFKLWPQIGLLDTMSPFFTKHMKLGHTLNFIYKMG